MARNFCGFNPRVDAVLETSLAALRDAGAVIVDPANIETARQIDEPEYEVLLYEFRADLNAYLAGLGPDAPVHSLAEVIAFNEANRDRVLPYFGHEHMLMAQACGPLTDEKYLRALADCRRLARDEGIDATLAKHQLDAIVAPSGGPAWLTDYVNGDHYVGGSSTPAAVAGYPEHHRARGIRLRAAGRHLVHRPGVERTGADPVRVRVRAGDAGAAIAGVHNQREAMKRDGGKCFTPPHSSGMIDSTR